uniref:serine/threonine-protein kinase pim-1-like n=1 Tax=Scatophagus argus TaxID=75038 RepID=UPI001ED82A83|nr:serine/threonine-protein kinase pim-1-like [Scatophagus argus]
MDSNSAKKIKNQGRVALRSEGKSGSTTEESAAFAQDGWSRTSKRKASPEKDAPRKKIRLSECEPQNTTKKEPLIKIRKDGVGPSKGCRLDLNQRSVSSSVNTDSESSSNQLNRGNTTEKDVSKSTSKRKAAAGEDGPLTKRRKGLPTKKDLIKARRAEFEARYWQGDQLGEGGFGCVFSGYRKADNLPVAIKHITKGKLWCKAEDQNGKKIPVEVAAMLKLQDGRTELVEDSAAVSLLDWYDLGRELVLVLERPVPCMDLLNFIKINRGPIQEDKAKIIFKQLVEAAKELEDKSIFHRDIKIENILIETSSDVPRVRLIDFGLSCFFKKKSAYRVFCGTLQHVPPEWYIQSSYRPGPSTVWQIGVVLYELLHRKVRFDTARFLREELTISDKLSESKKYMLITKHKSFDFSSHSNGSLWLPAKFNHLSFPPDCQDLLWKCLSIGYWLRPTLTELQLHPWLN